MTTLVSGRVVDDETGEGVPDVLVEALGDWTLTSRRLALTQTGNAGGFALAVKGPVDTPSHPAIVRLRVQDVAGRALADDRDVTVLGAQQTVEPIRVRKADREGLAVTQLTGEARFVSDGNALKLLVDGEEAFARIADDIAAAKTTIGMTQLFFSVPDPKPDPEDEHPRLVFRFGSQVIPDNPVGNEPGQPHRPRPGDVRPERLLVARAGAKVDVRILMNEPALGWPEGVFWLTVLPPIAAAVLTPVLALGPILLGIPIALLPLWLFLTLSLYLIEIATARDALEANTSDVRRLAGYFREATAGLPPTAGSITVRGLRQELPDHGVMHCKMVLVDGTRAVVTGSPFTQRYWDTHQHLIEEPRRGLNTAPAVHDMSVAVVGPAVTDLHETLRLYWNEEADPDERIEPVAPAPRGSGEDGVVDVQVVRTLSGKRFESLGGRSEKGILESYLRAFATARDYIYLETQYFTLDAIADGLIGAGTASKNLQVILLLNIAPDVPTYPRVQAGQVERLREALGDRLGVFTRWAYGENIPHSIAEVYLHTKAAVIDDRWATIGSANLDGLSLDHNVALSPLVAGETTASEVNVTVVGGPDAVAISTLLRRRLWSEHLGLAPDGPELTTRPVGGWLSLWRERAKFAATQINGFAPSLPGFVLAWPEKDAGSLTMPRRHLKALGFDVDKIRPVARLSQFDFFFNRWRTRSIEDTGS
jgi:phosphatidylserine/phosphatidylglycerophosphate/cardiolipin synthase-like enzyme